MTFLPVVQRELLVAARSATVRWQRFGAVAIGIVLFLVVLATHQHQPKIVGQSLFYTLASLLGLMAWISGPLYTADALTREKRDGTLGLLFLTDLQSYDVVLGKLTATALHQVMLLVGVFPVLALPVAMGGIAGVEFWRTVASLLLVQGVSLGLGIAASAMAPNFWKSIRTTLLVLGVLTLVPGAIQVGCDWLKRPTPAGVLGSSPLLLFLGSFEEYRRSRPEVAAGWSLGVTLHCGLILGSLGWACFWAQRRLEEPLAQPESYPRTRADEPVHPLTGWRHIHWQAWLDQNPYYWLARTCRTNVQSFNSLVGVLVVAAVILVGLSPWPSARSTSQFLLLASVGLSFLAHQLVKLGVCLNATGRMGEDRRTGALEILLTTPLTPKELVEGACQALQSEALRPIIALGALAVLQCAIYWYLVSFNFVEILVGTLFIFGGFGMLILDTRWAAVIGLRASLRETDPMRAFRGSVRRLLVPGWIGTGVLVVWVGTTGMSTIGLVFGYTLIYGLCLSLAASHARRARIDLDHGLREIAAGLDFDTSQRELADDFRKAAMTWEDRWFNRR